MLPAALKLDICKQYTLNKGGRKKHERNGQQFSEILFLTYVSKLDRKFTNLDDFIKMYFFGPPFNIELVTVRGIKLDCTLETALSQVREIEWSFSKMFVLVCNW